MLKKDLEYRVIHLETVIQARNREIDLLNREIDFLKKYSCYSNDLTRALSMSTEAVAHIIADLKRRIR